MGELLDKTPREMRIDSAYKAIGSIVFFAGCVSVAYSGYCVSVVGLDSMEPILGREWYSYLIVGVICFFACWSLDFKGIKQIWGFAVYEVTRFAILRQWTWPSLVVAAGALILGFGFISASAFTSFYGSKMAASLMANSSDIPKAETGTAQRDFEKAIAPARRRLDSLEKAKADAIALAATPYAKSAAKGNKTSIAVIDSISRAKDKAFSKYITEAQTGLSKAEKLHGGILETSANSLMAVAQIKQESFTAKNSAVWGIMVFFGIGSIVILAIGTALQSAMDAIRHTPAPVVYAKTKAKKEEEDWSAYVDDALQAPKPQSRPKQQGGNGQRQSPSHSPNSNSIPFDLN
jgi:hypothetical protein